MGAVLVGVLQFLWVSDASASFLSLVFRLGVLLIVGVVVYFGAARLLRCREMDALLSSFGSALMKAHPPPVRDRGRDGANKAG